MKRIGITGPTGAGKTTALGALEDLGACVIDADAVYHQLLADSAPLRSALADLTEVMHTDRIVILEDGRVHAVGTHESLLARDPIYQEIYASQMKGGDGDGPSAQREKA